MALWEVGGNCAAARASGCRGIEAEEAKGRRNRDRNEGIWKAMAIRKAMRATKVKLLVVSCSLAMLRYVQR